MFIISYYCIEIILYYTIRNSNIDNIVIYFAISLIGDTLSLSYYLRLALCRFNTKVDPFLLRLPISA